MFYLRWLIVKSIAWPLGLSGYVPPWPVAKAIRFTLTQFPGGQVLWSYLRPGPCPCPQCTASRGEATEPTYGECGPTMPPVPRC